MEKKKKKAAPRERVAIATAFTRATPQSIHLSYMLQPYVSTDRITWEVRFGGRKETGRLPALLGRTQRAENKLKEIKPQGEHRCPTADQLDRPLEKAHTAQLHIQAPSLSCDKMTESLHAKPR